MSAKRPLETKEEGGQQQQPPKRQKIRVKETKEEQSKCERTRMGMGVCMIRPPAGEDFLIEGDTALQTTRDGWCVAGGLIEMAWSPTNLARTLHLPMTVWAAGRLLSRTPVQEIHDNFLKNLRKRLGYPRNLGWREHPGDAFVFETDLEFEYLLKGPLEAYAADIEGLWEYVLKPAGEEEKMRYKKAIDGAWARATGGGRLLHGDEKDVPHYVTGPETIIAYAARDGGLIANLFATSNAGDAKKWSRDFEGIGEPERQAEVALAQLLLEFHFGPGIVSDDMKLRIRQLLVRICWAFSRRPPKPPKGIFEDQNLKEKLASFLTLMKLEQLVETNVRQVTDEMMRAKGPEYREYMRKREQRSRFLCSVAALYSYVVWLNLAPPIPGVNAELFFRQTPQLDSQLLMVNDETGELETDRPLPQNLLNTDNSAIEVERKTETDSDGVKIAAEIMKLSVDGSPMKVADCLRPRPYWETVEDVGEVHAWDSQEEDEYVYEHEKQFQKEEAARKRKRKQQQEEEPASSEVKDRVPSADLEQERDMDASPDKPPPPAAAARDLPESDTEAAEEEPANRKAPPRIVVDLTKLPREDEEVNEDEESDSDHENWIEVGVPAVRLFRTGASPPGQSDSGGAAASSKEQKRQQSDKMEDSAASKSKSSDLCKQAARQLLSALYMLGRQTNTLITEAQKKKGARVLAKSPEVLCALWFVLDKLFKLRLKESDDPEIMDCLKEAGNSISKNFDRGAFLALKGDFDKMVMGSNINNFIEGMKVLDKARTPHEEKEEEEEEEQEAEEEEDETTPKREKKEVRRALTELIDAFAFPGQFIMWLKGDVREATRILTRHSLSKASAVLAPLTRLIDDFLCALMLNADAEMGPKNHSKEMLDAAKDGLKAALDALDSRKRVYGGAEHLVERLSVLRAAGRCLLEWGVDDLADLDRVHHDSRRLWEDVNIYQLRGVYVLDEGSEKWVVDSEKWATFKKPPSVRDAFYDRKRGGEGKDPKTTTTTTARKPSEANVAEFVAWQGLVAALVLLRYAPQMYAVRDRNPGGGEQKMQEESTDTPLLVKIRQDLKNIVHLVDLKVEEFTDLNRTATVERVTDVMENEEDFPGALLDQLWRWDVFTVYSKTTLTKGTELAIGMRLGMDSGKRRTFFFGGDDELDPAMKGSYTVLKECLSAYIEERRLNKAPTLNFGQLVDCLLEDSGTYHLPLSADPRFALLVHCTYEPNQQNYNVGWIKTDNDTFKLVVVADKINPGEPLRLSPEPAPSASRAGMEILQAPEIGQ